MFDGISRVNKKSDEGGTTPKQRESSHEYDWIKRESWP